MKATIKIPQSSIEKLVKQLVVLVDKKEQNHNQYTNYFDKKNVKWEFATLKTADVSAKLLKNEELGLPFDINLESEILIERKGSGGNGLDELSGNFTAKRTEFENECIRMKQSNADLYLIIVNGSWEKIREHKYRSTYNESAFYNTLLSWRTKYGIHIDFVEEQYLGNHILRLLQDKIKKILEE